MLALVDVLLPRPSRNRKLVIAAVAVIAAGAIVVLAIRPAVKECSLVLERTWSPARSRPTGG